MQRSKRIVIAASLASISCSDNPTAPPHSNLLGDAKPLSAIAPAITCNLAFDRDRFASTILPWSRTSESVSINGATSELFIEPNGPVDDGFAAPCFLTGSWAIEVRARIVTGGANYVFPKVHGQFSNGSWFIVTSLPDNIHGWLLMVCDYRSWLLQDIIPGHTAPEVCNEDRWLLGPESVLEGQFMTLRISTDGKHLRLHFRRDGEAFTLVREVAFSTRRLALWRVGASQPWDAHVQITEMRAY